jgi:hypothetical protein
MPIHVLCMVKTLKAKIKETHFLMIMKDTWHWEVSNHLTAMVAWEAQVYTRGPSKSQEISVKVPT